MAYDEKVFLAIVPKVDKLRQNESKIEGAIEAIKDSWLKNYKTEDISELEARLAEMEEDVEADIADRDKVFEELKGLYSWSFV